MGGLRAPETLAMAEAAEPMLFQALVIGGMAVEMASFGCVELHGCSVAARRNVGRGRSRVMANGAAFLQSFAKSIGRPVSATTTPFPAARPLAFTTGARSKP